jgi:hypothetical protein
VHVDDQVEVLIGHLQEALVPQDAGVGDQDVQPAERLYGTCNEGLGGLGGAHRNHHGGGPAAVGLNLCNGLGGSLRVDVIDDDGGTLAGEFPRVGKAKTLAAPSDDCYFAVQAHRVLLRMQFPAEPVRPIPRGREILVMINENTDH